MQNNQTLRFEPLIALFLCIAMVVSLCGCSRKANDPPIEGENEFQAYSEPLTADDIAVEGDVYYASSQILLTAVRNADYQDIEKLASRIGAEIIGYISTTGDYQIRFNDSKSFHELEQIANDLNADAHIEDATLAYAAQLKSEAIPYTNDAWIDANNPSDISGSVWDESHPGGLNWWAEAIHMPSVWNMDLSLQTVKVGIIDSMFDTANKDLDENLFVKTWYNPVNEDGSCGVTQLYNNAVADYNQAVSNNDQTAAKNAKDAISKVSHGTHVAGIIAAQANNDFCITGINQNVELFGYCLLSDTALASDEAKWNSIFDIKCAIAHLLNEGVKVINMSLGFGNALTGTQNGDPHWAEFTSANSKAMSRFLLNYIEAGKEFLIVKCAGNEKKSDAKYDFLGAITNQQVAQRIVIVGAAEYNEQDDYYKIAHFSNIGSRVDVYAPGVDVLSVIPANLATVKDGTSMSTPIVAGLASLIWGINPDLSAQQVRNILIASTSASLFDLDDEFLLNRDKINSKDDPTAIVNAPICVQLALSTIGNGSVENREYGTLSGVVYAVTADRTDYADIKIDTISLYNENTGMHLTIPLMDMKNEDDVFFPGVHTYTTLIEPGTYILEAEAEGFEIQTQQVTIAANTLTTANFEFVYQVPRFLTQVTCIRPDGPQNKYTLTYNEDHMLQSYAIDYFSTSGNEHNEYRLTYNSDGQLIRYQNVDNPNPEEEYFYNANGTIGKWSYWEYESFRIDYYCEYDYLGRRTRDYTRDGKFQMQYTYNDDGLLMTEFHYADYGEISGTTVSEYTYDSDGNLIKQVFSYDWGDGETTDIKQYLYDYYPFVLIEESYDGIFKPASLTLPGTPVDQLVSFWIDETVSFEMKDGYLVSAAGNGYTYEFFYDGDGNGSFDNTLPAVKYEDEFTGTYLDEYEDIEITVTSENGTVYYLTYSASGITLSGIPHTSLCKTGSTGKSLTFYLDDYYPQHSGYVEICWDPDSVSLYDYSARVEGLDDTDGYFFTLIKANTLNPAKSFSK